MAIRFDLISFLGAAVERLIIVTLCFRFAVSVGIIFVRTSTADVQHGMW